MKFGVPLSLLFAAIMFANAALAHVSERALVLILPTNIYIAFGVAAVAVTVFLTVFMPPWMFKRPGGDGPTIPAAHGAMKPPILPSLVSFFDLSLPNLPRPVRSSRPFAKPSSLNLIHRLVDLLSCFTSSVGRSMALDQSLGWSGTHRIQRQIL
jgi:hypothetical protein